MRNLALYFAAIVAFSVSRPAFAQQPHTLTGEIRVHKTFRSKILNNDRDLVVYLPPGYESAKSALFRPLPA